MKIPQTICDKFNLHDWLIDEQENKKEKDRDYVHYYCSKCGKKTVVTKGFDYYTKRRQKI